MAARARTLEPDGVASQALEALAALEIAPCAIEGVARDGRVVGTACPRTGQQALGRALDALVGIDPAPDRFRLAVAAEVELAILGAPARVGTPGHVGYADAAQPICFTTPLCVDTQILEAHPLLVALQAVETVAGGVAASSKAWRESDRERQEDTGRDLRGPHDSAS